MTPVAYFGIKYHPDYRNKPEINHICSQIEETGVNTICVVRDIEHWGVIVLTRNEPELSTTLRGIADVIVSYDTLSDLDSSVMRGALAKCGIPADSK